VWPVVFYYIGGLAAIPIVHFCLKLSSRWLIVALVLTAYISNITQHALGNVLSVALLNLSAEIFWAALPLPLVEQTAFAIASGIITMPILLALQKANLLQYLNCGIFKKENNKQQRM
jgi:hypothetical protein